MSIISSPLQFQTSHVASVLAWATMQLHGEDDGRCTQPSKEYLLLIHTYILSNRVVAHSRLLGQSS